MVGENVDKQRCSFNPLGWFRRFIDCFLHYPDEQKARSNEIKTVVDQIMHETQVTQVKVGQIAEKQAEAQDALQALTQAMRGLKKNG